MHALCEGQNFDLVHFHTPWVPFLSLQILRRFSGAKVATFHDTPPTTFAGTMTSFAFRSFSRYILPRLDAVIAVSKSPTVNLAPVKDRSPTILPPCTDLGRFSPDLEPLGEFRDGKLNILYLGRLEGRKGIYQLLEAYRQLQGEGPPLRLLVAGDGDEMAGAKRYVSAHGLSEVVLLGAVTDAAKARLYVTADIFCSPARFGESFGIVLVEAMASATPVVAAANSGYRGVLTGEGARFLARPGDAGDLAAKLRSLIEDEDLRRQMGAWGRREAMKYDCRAIVPKLVEIYQRALASRSRKSVASFPSLDGRG